MGGTVEIDTDVRGRIARLAERRGTTPAAIVTAAIEREERAERSAAIEAAFDRLEADSEAWRCLRAEQIERESTLADGL